MHNIVIFFLFLMALAIPLANGQERATPSQAKWNGQERTTSSQAKWEELSLPAKVEMLKMQNAQLQKKVKELEERIAQLTKPTVAAESRPEEWPEDLWRTCWDGKCGWLDFTAETWKRLPANEQNRYAAAYQKWYAQKIKRPVEKTVESGIKAITMMLVPPGRFRQGPRKVTISNPFYLAKFEVTQKQWQSVFTSSPSTNKGAGPCAPVESVFWQDCQKFCRYTDTRMPTEAEWEYACRAGSTYLYCFGDDPTSLGQYAWYKENSNGKIHPVGEKLANAWGLHDIHGNLREMCQDYYGEYATVDETNPVGPSRGTYRVLRGSGFADDAQQHSRADYRNWSDTGRHVEEGFRVAQSIDSKDI